MTRPVGLADRFVTALLNHPLASLALAAAMVAGCTAGVTRLEADFSIRSWFRPADPLLQEFDAFERRFGSDESAIVLVHSPSGLFDTDSIRLLQEVTDDLWRVPQVIRVDSLTNFNWVHASGPDMVVEPLFPPAAELTPELLSERARVALRHEVIPGYLMGRDGTTAVVRAQLKPSLSKRPTFDDVLDGAREVIAKHRGRGDHTFYLTGSAILKEAFRESTVADMRLLIPASVLAIVLLLLFITRRLSGILLPLLVISTTVAMTLGAAGWLGMPLSNPTALVPQILLAIAVGDSVHILVTFYQLRGEGLPKYESARQALIVNFRPTLLTGVSTSFGFFSFAASELYSIAHMGILAGAGTILAWLMTYFVLAPLLVLLPSPRPTRHNAMVQVDRGLVQAFTGVLQAFRVPIVLAFGLLCVASIAASLTVRINSNPFEYFPRTSGIRASTDFMQQHVGGVWGPEIIINSGSLEGVKDPGFLRRVDAFQQWIAAKPYVTKTISLVDILKAVNRSLSGDAASAYVIPDTKEAVSQQLLLYTLNLSQGMDINDQLTVQGDALRLTTLWTLYDSSASIAAMQEIEAKARDLGLDARITGKLRLYDGMNAYIVSTFIWSMVSAILLVALLLAVAFRSIKTGLLALLPNLVPLAIGGGVLRLLDLPLDIGTVLVTSICLGVATDDTIHFISHYAQARARGLTARQAVEHIFSHAGPALLTTTIVLVVGFGLFALGSFVPNVSFGIMTAIVLAVALLADLMFLPAILLMRPGATAAATYDAAQAAGGFAGDAASLDRGM